MSAYERELEADVLGHGSSHDPTGSDRDPTEITYLDARAHGVRSYGEIVEQARAVYLERNERYRDNWRRFGWRGCLFRLRERAERAWDALWDAEPEKIANVRDTDDLIDLINFAVFTIQAIDEGNRDGEGGWW